MRFIAMIKSDATTEEGGMPEPEFIAAIEKYNEDLTNAGVMVTGEGLHPSSKGARVRVSDNDSSVQNGTFPDPTTLVAGYWIFQVDSLDDAIAWAKRCPTPKGVTTELELRQIYDMADFA